MPGTAHYSLVQPGTAQYSPVRPGTARYSPAQPGAPWVAVLGVRYMGCGECGVTATLGARPKRCQPGAPTGTSTTGKGRAPTVLPGGRGQTRSGRREGRFTERAASSPPSGCTTPSPHPPAAPALPGPVPRALPRSRTAAPRWRSPCADAGRSRSAEEHEAAGPCPEHPAPSAQGRPRSRDDAASSTAV